MPNGQNNPGSAGGRGASSEASDIDRTPHSLAGSAAHPGGAGVIDALVVGAVYGELTPSEQARLTSHFETHPNDQRVLDDLRAARQVIRDSRVADHDVDPPQSVSALLLQEAARRAPTRDAEQGWFARLVSALVAHPALASVASLVLVVGVAGTLYVNGEVQVAERPMAQSTGAKASRAGAAAPMEDPAAAVRASAPVSDKDGVRVGLDDSSQQGTAMELSEGKMGAAENPLKETFAQPKAKPALAKEAKPELARAKSDDPWKSLSKDDREQSLQRDGVRPAKKLAQNALDDSFDAPSDRASSAPESVASHGADEVVSRREPSVSSDPSVSGAMRNASKAQRQIESPAAIAADSESDRDEAPTGRFASPPRPAAPTANAQRPAAQVATAPQQVAPAVNAQRQAATAQQKAASVASAQKSASVGKAQQQAAPVASAPQKPVPVGKAQQQAAPVASAPQATMPAGTAGGYAGAAYGSDEAGYGRSDAKREAQSSTWTRDTHRRVLALVRAGKCQEASPFVQQLRSRDPNYYAANVAGDRSLGPCLARIAETAERDAKARNKAAVKAGAAQ